jgi:hypothetical protein
LKAEVQNATERLAAAEKQRSEDADKLRAKDMEISALKSALATVHHLGIPANDVMPAVDADALKTVHAADLESLRKQHLAELDVKERQLQEVQDTAASLRMQVLVRGDVFVVGRCGTACASTLCLHTLSSLVV